MSGWTSCIEMIFLTHGCFADASATQEMFALEEDGKWSQTYTCTSLCLSPALISPMNPLRRLSLTRPVLDIAPSHPCAHAHMTAKTDKWSRLTQTIWQCTDRHLTPGCPVLSACTLSYICLSVFANWHRHFATMCHMMPGWKYTRRSTSTHNSYVYIQYI